MSVMTNADQSRIVMLVDMNSFFASIEQACNPNLKGKPVLIGGSESGKGVVAAASYESRVFGIKSGMSMRDALRVCPTAIVVAGDLEKYEDIARQVFRICMDYTDMLEIYSIDECFLDVSKTADHFGGAVNIAKKIKARIKNHLRLTCSIGISVNKMLAKLASGMQKPDGLVEIKQSEIPVLLENMPVSKLHGIGNRLSNRLAKFGITTAGNLGRVSVQRLRKEFGIVGEYLHFMGLGIDESPVVPYYERPDAKSVGHCYTLESSTRDSDIIHRQLLRLSEMVGWRLREDNYAGRTITLTLRYADFHTFTRQHTISNYIDDGYDIYNAARFILSKEYDNSQLIRLIGVSVSNLVKGIYQPNLLSNPKWRSALKAMDSINNRFGEFTIKRASLMSIEANKKTHGFLKESDKTIDNTSQKVMPNGRDKIMHKRI